MNLMISQSGVASTLIKNFSDIIGVDFRNLPLYQMPYFKFDIEYEDSALVLFIQPSHVRPAHSIAQLDFSGLSDKLGLSDFVGRDLFYFQHVRDLLKAIQDAKTIFIVYNLGVYKHER